MRKLRGQVIGDTGRPGSCQSALSPVFSNGSTTRDSGGAFGQLFFGCALASVIAAGDVGWTWLKAGTASSLRYSSHPAPTTEMNNNTVRQENKGRRMWRHLPDGVGSRRTTYASTGCGIFFSVSKPMRSNGR